MKPVGHIKIPVVIHKGTRWGALTEYGAEHHFIGSKVVAKGQMTFIGDHKVYKARITDKVHWRIPPRVEADISEVAPGSTPRRRIR